MRIHPLATAIATLALAACATEGGYASKAASAQKQARFVTDAEYVAYVERKALSRGVEVYWVQPPTRAVAAADTDE